MTSEDVVHSFFVPAFRVKMDVIPGRYNTLWFQATRAGEYHMFCTEYCGTLHSGMIGRVVVMEPADYQRWLGAGATGVSTADAGAQLFERLGCAICHRPDGKGQGPSLAGLFGKTVKLQDGRTVAADEAYVRESILTPHAKITAGYPPVMPTFKGLLDEEGIMQIVAYVKSLRSEGRAQVRP
jgi:cytochrome c oxidase subunit 2